MSYTEPFLRKVETAQEEHQHQHQPQLGVSYRAAVAAKNTGVETFTMASTPSLQDTEIIRRRVL